MADQVGLWELHDVIEFFKEIGLVKKYEKELKKQNIDGKRLLDVRQGVTIKGIKKDDFKKIQSKLEEKIAEIENDEFYTNDNGFAENEFQEDESDSSEEYEEPETPPVKPQPVVNPRAYRDLPPTPSPDGFVGNAPPPPPVIKPPSQKTSFFTKTPKPNKNARNTSEQTSKKTTHPATGISQKPQQLITEEVYQEMDDVQRSSSEEEYLIPETSRPVSGDVYEVEPQPVDTRRPPLTKQSSLPSPTSPPVGFHPMRRASENSGHNLGITTQVIRNKPLKKTIINHFEQEKEQTEPSVDPSELSVKERLKLIHANTGKSQTLPVPNKPSYAKGMAPTSRGPPTDPIKARPPEPLPKPTKRDSGVSMNSNRSGNSQILDQQNRGSMFSHGGLSNISSDSSFSERSCGSSFSGSQDLGVSSGVTVVTRPKQKNVYHQETLESLEWFHGHVQKRAEVEKRLKEFSLGQNGAFLVRTSTGNPTRPYVLMVVYEKDVKNIPISVRVNKGNKFALGTEKPDERVFDTVQELIGFHKHEEIFVSAKVGDKVETGYVLLGLSLPKL